jgi:hypothetical protein
MEVESHPLKALLQLQLASDSSSALFLPYIADTLTADCFKPSPHLQKWIARVNSLLHSKDQGGRWAGLTLAHITCGYSKEILMENGQSWLGIALPLLTVRVLGIGFFATDLS